MPGSKDEESYEAILQICKDYEEGKFFYSKINGRQVEEDD